MESKVGIILISTNKYDIFVQPLIDSLEKFFFCGEGYDIYLFTDKPTMQINALRGTIYVRKIPAYRFPFATLYRYKIMSENRDVFRSEYLFYSDVDMRFVAPVGDEILADGLTAVRHPGFHRNNGWGSHGTHRLSLAYLKPELRHDYYCGGFQGGRAKEYLQCAELLSESIDIDFDTAADIGYTKNNSILADYHDEVFWNWYCKLHPPQKILTPEYCMVEQEELRRKWGIDKLTPRIVAIKKDHKEIRS